CSSSTPPVPAGTVSAAEPDWRLVGRAEAKSDCQRLEPPSVISRREAQYPVDLRRRGIEGTVVVEGSVSADGALEGVKVIRSAAPELSDTALDAFRAWRFKPALCDGTPIEAYVSATFSFDLAR
ncbi:MAG: energy transducer TonB, partial [Thermoanaerobaculia bacterium]